MTTDLSGVLGQVLSGKKWAINGTRLTVTYSFLTSIPEYYGNQEIQEFSQFSESQRIATNQAMSYWSRVANIDFIHLESGGQISFGNKMNFAEPEIWGEAYLPDGSQKAGDVWIDSKQPHWADGNANPTPGDNGFWVLIHEIGHALGLNHPAANIFHSLMNAGSGIYPQDPDWRPDQPMLWDIAGIQKLYGANMNAGTGDNTYAFSDEN